MASYLFRIIAALLRSCSYTLVAEQTVECWCIVLAFSVGIVNCLVEARGCEPDSVV